MRHMTGALGAASKLSVADALIAARMAAVALALPVLNRCLPLPTLLRLLDSRRRGGPSGDPQRALRLARGLLGQRLGPLRPGCFRQSLVLFHELRRSGHAARVVFGVTDRGDALDGHSWLELDGELFAEEADPRDAFTVVYAYPPAHTHQEGVQ